MGLHLGPTLANVFLGYKIIHLTLSLITTGVMLIISLFRSPHQNICSFAKFSRQRHANMPFTIENEKQNRMSFIDAQITLEDKTFTISV